jgi:hypothetical protein
LRRTASVCASPPAAIDHADGDRLALHRLEDAVEVVALQRQELVERGPPLRLVVGEDHPLHDGDAALAEEHVLGAAESDAAGAEGVGELGLVGQVGVGPDSHAPELVGPRQQLHEALIDRRLLGLFLSQHDLQDLARLRGDLRNLHLAGQPVEGDEVSFLDRLTVHAQRPPVLVDLQLAGADDRRLAHLAADHRRM